ncbi:hypothetical protein SAMN06265219_11156 [Gracilimonas mengyeensis]|uniref:Uncharacterized protein n=2 Tax=Gracilimonas mengyeensis TaxID=1302730 RepID=A0A521E9Z3_9BACT|nr:hypothetical protein SAMN06265219_11156 [Gracilimonas mengyeensis]
MQAQVTAQTSLGVIWDVPATESNQTEQLQTFSEHGVQFLEIEASVSSNLQEELTSYPFEVMVRLSPAYLTINDTRDNRNELKETYFQSIESYRDFEALHSIGLLTNSMVQHPDFDPLFNPLLDSLRSASGTDLYFSHGEQWFYFSEPQQAFARQFYDLEFDEQDLISASGFLQSSGTNSPSAEIHFIHSQWLLQALNDYPEFSKSLLAYRTTGEWHLPLPEATPQALNINWLVLVLILLWISLALQFKYLPYIRPMMLRFFFAHRFFVDDILQYRERAAVGGSLLMLKHALFGGMVTYLTGRILLSEEGLTALLENYPLIAIAGNQYISLFFFAALLILITDLISIFWLYLPAKNLNHLSQVINLYAGSFYLDFILVTFMATSFLAGWSPILVLSLAAIFVLIWFLAYNLAAFNASTKMGQNRTTYLLLTIGLHTLVLILFLVVFFTQTDVLQVLKLALSL